MSSNGNIGRRPAVLVLTLLVIIFLAPSVLIAGEGLSYERGRDGQLQSRTPDGNLLWRLGGIDASLDGTVRQLGAGRILIDDTLVVDRWGRLVERRSGKRESGHVLDNPPADSTTAITDLAWDQPVDLVPDWPDFSNYGLGPVLDSQGRAWVVVLGTGEAGVLVQYTRSTGLTNDWEPMETIYTMTDAWIGETAITIDNQDRITVVCRVIQDGYRIYVLRYVPGQGWSEPEMIYQEPNENDSGFGRVMVAAAANGDVLVGFDLDWNRMATIRYDAATDTWGRARPLSPPWIDRAFTPTLVRNRDGSAIYALFDADDDRFPGIYVARYGQEEGTWTFPRRPRGVSRGFCPGGTGVGAAIPAAVDDSGNLTFFFYTRWQLIYEDLWFLRALRVMADGSSGRPAVLAVHYDYEPDLVQFADAAVSPAGDVMLVFKRTNTKDWGTELYAFHYDAAADQWDSPALIYRRDDQGGAERVRVAFRDDGTAVCTYVNAIAPPIRLTSKLFDGTQWLPDPVPIPGERAACLHETSGRGSEVVMWYEDYQSSRSIYGAWLRETVAEMSWGSGDRVQGAGIRGQGTGDRVCQHLKTE